MRRHTLRVVVALFAVLMLSSCAQVVTGLGRAALPPVAPDATVDINGAAQTPMDTLAANALTDITEFWKANFDKISAGKVFEPLSGGIYSVDPDALSSAAKSEPCLARAPTAAKDNAFYCRLDDAVVYSRTGFIPKLAQDYGTFIIAMIFAHEFGHAIQDRLSIDPDALITLETQADCFAGAFTQWALANKAPHFRVSLPQLDNTLVGYLQLKDPEGLSSTDEGTHGNGFDRLSALATGIDGGVAACTDNWDARKFTERAYTSENDYQNNGNQPLSAVIDPAPATASGGGGGGLQPDLNAFWKAQATSIGKTWTDVKFEVTGKVTCNGSDSASEFSYCPSNNTVYITQDVAQQAYGSGDFALGAVIAYGWGMAVRHQLFGRTLAGPKALLAAACYTGAYAANVNVDAGAASRDFTLSPPDMDEATVATLKMVASTRVFGPRGTDGLQRISSFDKGYFQGLSGC